VPGFAASRRDGFGHSRRRVFGRSNVSGGQDAKFVNGMNSHWRIISLRQRPSKIIFEENVAVRVPRNGAAKRKISLASRRLLALFVGSRQT
jgi:hypothetical protein